MTEEERLRRILMEIGERHKLAYTEEAAPYHKALEAIIAAKPPMLIIFDDRVDVGLDTGC